MASVIRAIRIQYLDREPVEVPIPPKVQIRFEDNFDMSLSELSRVNHVYWLAWAAATHNGSETRDYDAFLDAIADVEPVTETSVPERPTLVAQ